MKGKSSKNYNFYYSSRVTNRSSAFQRRRARGGRPGPGCRGGSASGRLRRPQIGIIVPLQLLSHRAFLTVRHTSFVSGLQRPSAAEGLETKLGLQRERLRRELVGIIMSLHCHTKTPVTACISDRAIHFRSSCNCLSSLMTDGQWRETRCAHRSNQGPGALGGL